jgi:hypothetical protein
VFDPARFGEDLGEFFLGDGYDVGPVVENDGPGACRALVEGQHVFFAHLSYLPLYAIVGLSVNV